MSDPYKVLNIPPTATDDEVKHAYRQLARKYHPDNYQDNPLADLAQEKMKEINEAYEQIQRQRKIGSAAASSSDRGENGYRYGYGGSAHRAASGSPLMQRVRMAIAEGDISQAERLLNEAEEHDAEWNFLMAVVSSRRGWMDDAKRYLETACRMDPTNEEYRAAMNRFAAGGFHPEGYRGVSTMSYDSECLRYCATLAICSCCSGGRFCILPC